MSEDLELKGRRALVTGGTQGIGAAVVARLREAGVRVLATARTTPAETLDAELFVAADVATAEGCAILTATGGRVDGIAQWVRLDLDEVTRYENRPGTTAGSEAMLSKTSVFLYGTWHESHADVPTYRCAW